MKLMNGIADALDVLKLRVRKRELYLSDGRKVGNRMAVCRTDNGAPLGIVGRGYEVVQYADAFRPIVKMVQKHGGEIVKADLIDDGGKAYLEARFPGVFVEPQPGDIVEFRASFLAGHDGQTGVKGWGSARRLICKNGMTLPASRTETFHVYHKRGAGAEVKTHSRFIEKAIEDFRNVGHVFNELVKSQMGKRETVRFLNRLVPNPERGKSRTRSKNVRRRMFELAQRGKGINRSNRWTRWAAYNAVTEYVTHERGTDRNRLKSSIVGSGARMKDDALELLAGGVK